MRMNPLNWKANKRMEALGVDEEAAEEEFKREKKAGYVCLGYVTFTENWLYFESNWTAALFPLKEIEAFQKSCASMGRGADFYVRLFFKDGGNYRLHCAFTELDDIAAALIQRCPQVKAKRAESTFL